MTHADLVKIAERWLLGTRKCAFALTELTTCATSEIPDAIGFRTDGTILVECKASRADFLRDKKKIFRRNSWMGVGDFRFFLCPEGIIKPQDLPEKWGLVIVDAKGRCRQIAGPKWNNWNHAQTYRMEKDIKAEHGMMMSALRRLHLRGVLPLIYDNPYIKKMGPADLDRLDHQYIDLGDLLTQEPDHSAATA